MKSDINICILLTVLTIVILILYFYLNRNDTNKQEVKQDKQGVKQDKQGVKQEDDEDDEDEDDEDDVKENFYDVKPANKTKYVVLVQTAGSYLHIKRITLYDKDGNEIPTSSITAQSNSLYSASVSNASNYWGPDRAITGDINWEGVDIYHTDINRTQETNPPFYFKDNLSTWFTYINPYLLITLNTPTELSKIKIRNRVSCCQYRINGSKLLAYDENLREQWSNTIMDLWRGYHSYFQDRDYNRRSTYEKTWLDWNYNVDYNPSTLTKYVVLLKTRTYSSGIKSSTKYDVNAANQYAMNIAQVTLFDKSGRQIPRTELTVQTNSLYKENPPANLINGNTSSNNFAHTFGERNNNPGWDPNTGKWNWDTPDIPNFNFLYYPDYPNGKWHDPPYFVIALKNPTELGKITITNRADCCQDRINNVKIIFYNEDITNLREQWSYTFKKVSNINDTYKFYGGSDQTKNSLTMEIPINYNVSNNWNDRGCFNDSKGDRLIKPIQNKPQDTNKIPVFGSYKEKREHCMNFASEIGANIISLQNEDECWVGTDNNDSYRQKNILNSNLDNINPKSSSATCTEMGGSLSGRVWTLKTRPEPDIDFSTQSTKTYRIIIERPKYDNYNDNENNYYKEIVI